jgi:glycosyltransferase involved in cell wall biosynthesis
MVDVVSDPRPMRTFTSADVSAIVCTLNSESSIAACLESLRKAGVGELIVVDGRSSDSTIAIAERYADTVIFDEGTGLGAARNRGIKISTLPLILNMGSDNVMPNQQLEHMIAALITTGAHAVGAQTRIAGTGVVVEGLNAWRMGRFPPGEVAVIGTPSLFYGHELRRNPYDPSRKFSDDSELCERWRQSFNARFAIADAFVWESGKSTWPEVVTRARMYGESDAEVFHKGSQEGWGVRRKLQSLTHPLKADFIRPVIRLDHGTAVRNAPFLVAFTGLRYLGWLRSVTNR